MTKVDLTTQTLRAQAGVGSGRSTRTAAVSLFAGFAGFGAGAVNLAITSSLLLPPAAAAGPLAVPAGVAAALWGSTLLIWTVLTLHRGRLLWAKPAVRLLLAASLVHAAALVAGQLIGPSSLEISQLAALLLTLMIVAAAGWLRRHDDGGVSEPVRGDHSLSQPRAGRLLLAAFGCAVLVAGVATPGLAASTAGGFAVPHGSHGTTVSNSVSGGSQHGH